MSLALPVCRLENFDPGLALPAYASAAAAGMDLRACLAPADRAAGIRLASLERALIPTGLAIAVPEGHEAQIRPRSGLALRHGLSVLNSPGTIDADYRGEIRVLLANLGTEPVVIAHGERVAQMVLAPVAVAAIEVVAALAPTGRGAGGFGSTGVV